MRNILVSKTHARTPLQPDILRFWGEQKRNTSQVRMVLRVTREENMEPIHALAEQEEKR